MLAIQMIEAGGDISRHFQMLDLILTYRHLAGFEHQNIGGHQDRIAEQSHGDAFIGVAVRIAHVLRHRCLVSVRTVHQALGSYTGDDPVQFQDFWNIGLGVKDGVIRVQTQGQPSGGDL